MMTLLMFLLKILIIEVRCVSLRLMFLLNRWSAAFYISLEVAWLRLCFIVVGWISLRLCCQWCYTTFPSVCWCAACVMKLSCLLLLHRFPVLADFVITDRASTLEEQCWDSNFIWTRHHYRRSRYLLSPLYCMKYHALGAIENSNILHMNLFHL